MVEGGVVTADKTEFRACWNTIWTTPYVLKLAVTAGIGGLLFGYDTGVISGALLFIREDFEEVEKKTWVQETIVSMAVAGAIIGAGSGGWLNDKFGRKKAILVADFVFLMGSLVMAIAPGPWVIVIGRILVGLGVGMASMTSPLYISEASPAHVRGALVGTNNLLITFGQFLSYCINIAFTEVKGTWRWMLGIAGVPALIQFLLMLMLPESPRWLFRQNRVDEARAILEKIYGPEEVEGELKALQMSLEEEMTLQGSVGGGSTFSKVGSLLKDKVARRGLYASVIALGTQQFVGINTVMYYSPTIVQFAGFASKKTAMAISLVTSGLNAMGSILNMFTVDRFGRRRLLLFSLVGVIGVLTATFFVFHVANSHAPKLDEHDSRYFHGSNSTCSAYLSASDGKSWDCKSCLKVKCGFCSNPKQKYGPGACLVNNDDVQDACLADHRTFFQEGCPSKIGFVAVILLGAYILIYSPGMGSVPWILNSEIFPLRYRGIGAGIGATSCWVANLIVTQTFLTLSNAVGPGGTFLLYAAFGVVGLFLTYFFVPETKGKSFEQIEKMLSRGYKPKLFRKRGSDY